MTQGSTAEETSDRVSSAPLRPYFVVRASGLPVEEVEALAPPAVMDAFCALQECQHRIETARDGVGEVLFAAIGSIAEKRPRNQLLQLRRDLFNGREPRPADAEIARGLLPPQDWGAIVEYSRLAATLRNTEAKAIEVFQQALNESRRRLQVAFLDEDFRRGLLVSSESLSLNLKRYCAKSPELFGSREEQIERGLLRYFTRTAMKATPFASLCAVLPGYFIPVVDRQRVAFYTGDAQRKRGVVRLNKSLFAVLWGHLKTRQAVRMELFVELTPSLTRDHERLGFLSAAGGREFFHRIAKNAALDRVCNLLSCKQGLPLSSVVRALCEDTDIEASHEDAVAYLNQLIDVGLLRFQSGIAEHDADWDLTFEKKLSLMEDEHARRAAVLLRTLREQLCRYAASTADERELVVPKIRAEINEAFDALGIRARLRSDMPFYEDAGAEASLQVPVTEEVQTATEVLQRFVELVLPLSFQRNEQATMRHFFDKRYGPSTQQVPLLQFYEEYYREHFKAHLERERLARSPQGRASIGDYSLANPFQLDVINRRASAVTALSELLRRRWREQRNAEELVITTQEMMAAVGGVDPLPEREHSLSIFCQLDYSDCKDAGAARGVRYVMPGGVMHLGRGKYFSRFLYLLPDEVRDAVFAHNNAVEDELRAEICADGEFNGNLHPPLLQWEISYPTSESSRPDHQILSSELMVTRDPGSPSMLRLVHLHSGLRVVPHDLGFLNPQMRPPLFQLLSRFGPVGTSAISLPDQHSPSRSGEPRALDAIEYRPRISFEGRVVIARRRWTVPSSLFPARRPGEEDGHYFIRLNRWREENGIPQQAYLRVKPTSEPTPPAPPEAARPIDGPGALNLVAGPSYAEELCEDHWHDASDIGEGDDAAAVFDAGEARARPESPEPTHPAANQGVLRPGPQAPRYSRDWTKPQFIDFGSPVLIKLFAQIPAALSRFVLLIEERLPDAAGLPRNGARHFATEMILQLDLPASVSRNRASHGSET